MRYLVAGTAGHIDHGKTELVKALTGTNPDRLKEEQERGITIDIGFAHLDLPGVRLGFVDVPGHERFIKNMLAGAWGIDLVVLVVAADESIKPQTREHFDICRLLDVKAGLVALTKIDLVDAEIQEIAKLETREFVRGSFLEGAPIVPLSARTGEGIPQLRDALRATAMSIAPRDDKGLFRLPIDRAFSVRGFGTVVTGTLTSGSLRPSDEVEVLPEGKRGRVRGIEVHGEAVEKATKGQRTAVNLQGLATEDVARGCVLAYPATFAPSRLLDARVSVLDDSPIPLKDLSRVRFHAGTSEILARVKTLESNSIEPGRSEMVQLRLESPAVLIPGDRFILRRYSPPRTIAGGVILDGAPEKHRRGEPRLIESLERLRRAGLEEMISIFVEESGEGGITLAALARRCGAMMDETAAALASLAGRGRVRTLPADMPRAVSVDILEGLARRAEEILLEFHRREPLRPGLPREELRVRLLRNGPAEVFRGVIDSLVSAVKARIERDVVAHASHRVELGEEERSLRERLERALLSAGLDPPSLQDVLPSDKAARGSAERILHLLLKEGRLARLPDGRLVHGSALNELRRRLYQFRLKSEIIDIASFKDLAGVSRKNAIPLLELLDAEKVTIRCGNDRRILPER